MELSQILKSSLIDKGGRGHQANSSTFTIISELLSFLAQYPPIRSLRFEDCTLNKDVKFMKKYFELPVLFMVTLAFTASMAIAKDYVIYSISQDIPMGYEKEVLRKNFYIDMGKNQGVSKGSVLDVYRVVSVLDPYESKKRFNHKIKIGEVKVLHAEETSSIGVLNKLEAVDEAPVFEIGKLMIGDVVTAHVK